jgi:hypothetical protein
MAEETTVKTTESAPAKTTATKPMAKSGIATYNKEEAKTITVQTTGDFQLYDPTTQTLYAVDEKVKRPENDMFVQTNIERGKLKKVS